MTRNLVLLRHGKSDWDVPATDRERPLTARGRRQACQAGEWLAAHGPALDLAVVSTARRTTQTWELASAALADPPPVRPEEAAYSFSAGDLLGLVRAFGEERSVVLVGHDPALEDLLDALVGRPVRMRTAELALLELADWDTAGDGAARLVAHGRPPVA